MKGCTHIRDIRVVIVLFHAGFASAEATLKNFSATHVSAPYLTSTPALFGAITVIMLCSAAEFFFVTHVRLLE